MDRRSSSKDAARDASQISFAGHGHSEISFDPRGRSEISFDPQRLSRGGSLTLSEGHSGSEAGSRALGSEFGKERRHGSKSSVGSRSQRSFEAQPTATQSFEMKKPSRCHACTHNRFVKWCCAKRRRRRHALSKNRWIDLAPRRERRRAFRRRKRAATAELLKLWWAQNLPCYVILWRRMLLGIMRCIERLAYAKQSCSRQVDRKTGLPVEVLVRWRLLSLESDGPHGLVFKAHENRSITGSRGSEGATSAVRIRDKSRGNCCQLPFWRAYSVLRGELIEDGYWLASFTCVRFVRSVLLDLGMLRPRFQHKCLVEQRAVFDTKEFFVEVTDYVGGMSLYDYVQARREQLDEFEACCVFKRVLMGLEYLHGRGLMHRDVRLPQVLLGKRNGLETAQLCDFWCVARIPRRAGHLVDRSRPVELTSAAPEVLQDGEWSDKSDMWSAGCLLFELLHGHPPFSGKGDALMQRICTEGPTFDKLCGKISESGVDLLRQLLRRLPYNRPSAAVALKHPWFHKFATEPPAKRIRREGHRIRCVRLHGKAPLSRAGSEAANLLACKAGEINSGFCTYMGLTHVSIDFEIAGKDEGQEYWLTGVTLSLLGTTDNPKRISLQTAARPGAPFVDVCDYEVPDASCREVKLVVNQPMRWVRLSLKQSFGGQMGIALRRVSFFGYEIRAIRVIVDTDAATFSRGAAVHTHTDMLLESAVDELVHSSLHGDVTRGKHTAGATVRYKALRDILSGKPHHSSQVRTRNLRLPTGVRICAATLGLRYLSVCPVRASPPRLKLHIVRDYEERDTPKSGGAKTTMLARESTPVTPKHGGHGEGSSPKHGEASSPEKNKGPPAPPKTILFETSDLITGNWSVDEIMQNGYFDHRQLFIDLDECGQSFPTDDGLCLSILFDNFAGFCHIPADLGLTLYYVPELLSPRSDSEEEKEDHEGAKPGSAAAATLQAAAAQSTPLATDTADIQAAGESRLLKLTEKVDDEVLSEHPESDIYEKELQDRRREIELNLDPNWGDRAATDGFRRENPETWVPDDLADELDGVWWKKDEGQKDLQQDEDEQTTNDSSGNGSNASGASSARDHQEEGQDAAGAETVGRDRGLARLVQKAQAKSQSSPKAQKQKTGLAKEQSAAAAKRAAEVAERLALEASKLAEERAYYRKKQARERHESTQEGMRRTVAGRLAQAIGIIDPGSERPGGDGAVPDVEGLDLETSIGICGVSLARPQQLGACAGAIAAPCSAPLTACGFTPAPPPPSPRV